MTMPLPVRSFRAAVALVALVASASAFAGCAARRPVAEVDRSSQDKFADRAAFELDCPKAELTFTCVQRGNLSAGVDFYDDACVSWGVSGCDMRAVYSAGPLGFRVQSLVGPGDEVRPPQDRRPAAR